MLTTLWALHHATQTSASVWVRHTSNGALTVTCNGSSFTGSTIDTALHDGCGICSVTGLAAGSSYPFTAYVAGVEVVSGTLKTMPATGSTFSVGFASCFSCSRDNLPLNALVETVTDLSCFFFSGDNIYNAQPATGTETRYGESLTRIENILKADKTDEAGFKAQTYRAHRAWWRTSGYQVMQHEVPCWFKGDDHDGWVGNDWDWTLVKANGDSALYGGPWATVQADLERVAPWIKETQNAYYMGNPNNTLGYWTTRINDDVELFFLECIYYRDAADGSGTTLLGATQLAWFKAALAASTATFKLIMSTKNLYGGADDYGQYPAERTDIEDFIYAQSGWAKPGGVVWTAGDIHYPYVAYRTDKPMLNICSSPAGQGIAEAATDGYTGYKVYKSSGNISINVPDPESYQCAAFIRVHGSEKLTCGIVDMFGAIKWQVEVMAGTNEISYPQMRLG